MSIEDDDKEFERYGQFKKTNDDNPIDPHHYNRYPIEPIEFISKNNLGFIVGNIIKYIMRYDKKNGLEDLKKARWYLDFLINEEEYKEI